MKLTDLNFETETFPEHLCTKQNPRETGVWDSEQSFLCIIHDPRGFGEGRIKVLMPYTSEPSEDDDRGFDLLYGWTDGNNVFDHKDRDIHDDDEKVIAWVELPAGTDARSFNFQGLF